MKLSYKAYMGNFMQIEMKLSDDTTLMANISKNIQDLVDLNMVLHQITNETKCITII